MQVHKLGGCLVYDIFFQNVWQEEKCPACFTFHSPVAVVQNGGRQHSTNGCLFLATIFSKIHWWHYLLPLYLLPFSREGVGVFVLLLAPRCTPWEIFLKSLQARTWRILYLTSVELSYNFPVVHRSRLIPQQQRGLGSQVNAVTYHLSQTWICRRFLEQVKTGNRVVNWVLRMSVWIKLFPCLFHMSFRLRGWEQALGCHQGSGSFWGWSRAKLLPHCALPFHPFSGYCHLPSSPNPTPYSAPKPTWSQPWPSHPARPKSLFLPGPITSGLGAVQ